MVALGLLGVTFIAYAIIYPLNGAPSDAWLYLFWGQQRVFTIPLSYRQFGYIPPMLLETFLPGNPPAYFFVQQLMVFASSFSLFHITRRLLPGRDVFALLYAILFILYIPVNRDLSRPLFAGQIYTWVLLLMVLATLLFIEAVRMRSRWGWLVLLISAVMGYMSIRAYETAIPLVLSIPFLVVFLKDSGDWRKRIGRVLLWWIPPGAAAAVQVLSLLQSAEDEYQGTFIPTSDVPVVQRVLSELNYFFNQSFSFGTSLVPTANYLLPSLLLTGFVLVLVLFFWRQQGEAHPLLKWQQSLMVLVAGVYFTFAGSLVWAYLGYSQYGVVYRAHFHAAPGQALFVTALIAALALLLKGLLRVSPRVSVVVLLLIVIPAAGHWFFDAQREAHILNQAWMRFDEQIILQREVSAAAPDVVDDTLIILVGCQPQAAYPPHRWVYDSPEGMLYLYGLNIRAEQSDWLTFTAEDVIWEDTFIVAPPIRFPYDQVIAFACQDERIYILDQLPADLLPAGTDTRTYNPYARIEQGFLTDLQRRVFSW